MKINIISSLYPPLIFGGAEISVKRVAEKLADKGHMVSVISTSPNRKRYREEINGVSIHRINPMNIYPMYTSPEQPMIIKPVYYILDIWNPYSYKIIKNILKKEQPDIVHINNFRGISLSAFSAAKSLKLPVVFTAHDYSLICLRGTLLNTSGMICTNPIRLCNAYAAIQRFIISNNMPDLVIAPSQFMIDKLKEADLFGSVRTMKHPLGIELEYYGAKKDYDIIDILYVGGLRKHKGVQVLINAFKNIQSKHIMLHICGKGENEDEFKIIAGSDKRIIFHGFVPDNELIDLYIKANILVVPSIWYDNSPTVIYESLMAGTPVIGSRIGGIAELIEDGHNGYLFESGNADELEKILENLVKDIPQLKRLEEGAIESVKKYSMEHHIMKLERVYDEIRGI